MSLSSATIDRSRDLALQLLRAPLCLYKLGWGPALNWLPLLILTTRGRNSGLARHVLVEYRRHGSKYYIVSGWGADADWYRNIQQDNRVTIQRGEHIVDARAQRVDDPAEALRALYMFSPQLLDLRVPLRPHVIGAGRRPEYAGRGGGGVHCLAPGSDRRRTRASGD